VIQPPLHTAVCKEAYECSLNDELYMKVLTGLIVDDLQWKRWDAMISTTYALAAQHSTTPDTWFAQQLSLTLQRLLKGIVLKEACRKMFCYFTISIVLTSLLYMHQ
jgi:hypothetical protein